MADFTKTGIIPETPITKAYKELKDELNAVESRTVDSWNDLRQLAKAKYDSEVIWMLDASGLINAWLNYESI